MPNQGFFSAFLSLAKPYWTSRERAKGLLLLASVIGLSLGLVWINVRLNSWNASFYNAIQEKKIHDFYRLLGTFTLLAFAFIGMGVYRLYLQQMLQIEWRTWLNDRYLANWLDNRAYYRMQLLDQGTDNPDQRIAEDLRLFVDTTLSLGLGLLSSVVTLISFVFILWVISGPLSFSISGIHIVIPGYMVWFALFYTLAGSLLTHKIGRPLIQLQFDQQRFEADFRFSLVRLRENSEGVALYRGEGEELANFRGRFRHVIRNWRGIMKKRKELGFFTISYSQIAIIFPFVVAAPRYFSGAIQLGGLMQIASAFGQVQGALSWFIDAYTQFATWKATVDRLTGFSESLRQVREESKAAAGERRREEGGAAIGLEEVNILLPQGQSLFGPASLRLKPGEATLISGPSGAGKSTLFRAIAGIWPYWRGRITIPQGARLLFLPQRPYLPVGTLKHAVCYPSQPELNDDEAVREALCATGLAGLVPKLASLAEENWAQILSGGEQQRLAFARALINRPDWLFLDEATSALPDREQAELYRLLPARLPQTTVISIGHRDNLSEFHPRRLTWETEAAAPTAPYLAG